MDSLMLMPGRCILHMAVTITRSTRKNTRRNTAEVHQAAAVVAAAAQVAPVTRQRKLGRRRIQQNTRSILKNMYAFMSNDIRLSVCYFALV